LQNPKDLGIAEEGHAPTVKQEEGVQELKDLIAQYSHVTVLFQGVRKIEDKKISKTVFGKFHTRP